MLYGITLKAFHGITVRFWTVLPYIVYGINLWLESVIWYHHIASYGITVECHIEFKCKAALKVSATARYIKYLTPTPVFNSSGNDIECFFTFAGNPTVEIFNSSF